MMHPQIIQGGMGAAASNWRLARTVSILGQLGVVSGTALAVVLARRLQNGDVDRRMRYALDHFPIRGIAERVLAEYFIARTEPHNARYKSVPLPGLQPGPKLTELTVAANFVEVFLAKHNQPGLVGINLLEKIQFPTLASLYGAMLADVDYVLMGAGIPRSIPGVLDRFANGEAAELKIDVEQAVPGEEFVERFDPKTFCGGPAPRLKRPQFLGIVASATLALTLAKKSNGRVDGFVVEGETAGGHNAPPRGPMHLSATGEPIYGERDVPDLEKIRALGLPFWLAGSYGKPGKLAEALSLGAAGIQVGTAFAFCEESGITAELKQKVLQLSREGKALTFTDPVASPTGFPFKVVSADGTLADNSVYETRVRICDLGYLRTAFRRPDGTVGYRCPAEPVDDYIRKGGQLSDTVGRKCVCNGLLAAIGLTSARDTGSEEPALLTAGNDVSDVAKFLKPGQQTYTATDVIERLLMEQTR